MQKQTSRLDELFEQAPEAIAVLSTDDRIVRINKEFTRMFGYEPDEVLQRPINDLIVPEAQVESSRAYTRLLERPAIESRSKLFVGARTGVRFTFLFSRFQSQRPPVSRLRIMPYTAISLSGSAPRNACVRARPGSRRWPTRHLS